MFYPFIIGFSKYIINLSVFKIIKFRNAQSASAIASEDKHFPKYVL